MLASLRKWLADLLSHAARSLEESDDLTPQAPTPEKPEVAPAEKSVQTELAINHFSSTPPTRLWQHIVSAERNHLRWLQEHPPVIAMAVALAIILVIAEKWLIIAWQWLVSQVNLYWPRMVSHPVALVGVGTILFCLIFGLRWLYYIDDLVHWILAWINAHRGLSAVAGGILLLIGLWLANNYNTWVVLPFAVGQIESTSLNGEKVALQLIAELNQVGVGNPPTVLIMWKLGEPLTSSGGVTARRDLPLGECDVVLQGPGEIIASQSVSLTRVQVQASSQRNPLDLGNLSIGTINIPLQLFTQFILRILPSGYREFSGQINEENGELKISVSSRNPPNAWRVAGPSPAFPEMMEYLALRMTLDLNPDVVKFSGLNTPPSDRDLAFAMGNHAYRERRYQAARAFFELADRFAPLDEKVDAMLGLTHYQLALEQPSTDSARFDAALRAMKVAIQEDPDGDSSLLRPYLACLYDKAGQEAQAQMEINTFTRYLRLLEYEDQPVRVEALKQLPLGGPGRHLFVDDGDVIFVDATNATMITTSQTLSVTQLLPQAQNPRQIRIYDESKLLFISPDGTVLTYTYRVTDGQSTPTTLIEGRALNGVRQISTSYSQFERTNLFLLNRFGQIYWCELDAQVGSTTSTCPLLPERPLVQKPFDARQIFPLKDRLYILTVDGAVLYTDIGLSGYASTPQQLTSADQVREIFVASDNTLYLLHDNGNIWRYYDDGRPETRDLELIDQGTGTSQIFEEGGYLYLLKSSGSVWRISSPRNPSPEDITEIVVPSEGTTIREIFVTVEQPEGEGNPSRRAVYLLSDQGVLLRGIDTGDARITLTQQIYPSLSQAASP